MRRVLAFIAAVALAAVPFGLPAGAAPAPAWHVWRGQPTGVDRTAAYDRGEWIATNGLWQALGANADGLHRTDYYRAFYPAPGDPTYATRDLYNALTYDFFGSHRAAHNGDYQLPTDAARWPDGTADLAEVRLAVDGADLFVRFLWNSFPRPDAQIATLTFAPAGATAPAAAWPRNAGLRSRWSVALTVWGSGGALAAAGGGDSPVAVRVGDHVTEARVPLSALPAGPWSLTGGAGLDDPAHPGQYWTVPAGPAGSAAPGSGGPIAPTNVWDLLFAKDTPWTFDERKQADDLAAGDAGSDTAVVDPALLRSGATRHPAEPTGDLSRIFRSSHDGQDGIAKDSSGVSPITPPAGFSPPIPNPGFNVSYFYTGAWQTYSMHVPARYPASTGAWPLIVYLHGFTGTPEEPFYNPVGLVQQADAHGYLLASAFGRGDYFYRGEGDLDVLEVIRDVERHYRVDPDRIYLMGHSMGGYGTNNVATHHPDRFAAVAPAEGTDSADLAANLRDLPWFEMTADEDLDAGAQQANALYSSLSGRGYDATLIEYRLKIHEYSSIYDTLPRLFRFFGAHTRVADPPVVTWRRPAGQDRPDLGLVYDGAYWVDGVAPAPGKTAEVTVESDGIAHRRPDPAKAGRTDQAVDEGGPTGRTAAQLKQTVPGSGAVVPVGNVLHLHATGASALTVDAARARLQLRGADLTVRGSADGPVRLSLARLGVAAADVTVDGRPAGRVVAHDGMLTVSVPEGSHVVVLGVRRRAGSLAATGLPAGLGAAALGLLAIAGAAAVCRRPG